MTRTKAILLAIPTLALAAACNKASNPGDKGHTDPGKVDTGGDDTGAPCTAEVVGIDPEDGTTDFYWRDTFAVVFSEPAEDLAAFSLVDGSGAEVELRADFDDSGLNATVGAVDGLAGDTAYTLTVEVCGAESTVSFATSAYGLPLEVDPTELVGNTYDFDLGGADYVEPAGLGALIGLYLSEPLLIGVVDAGEDTVSLMGAQGTVDASSQIHQDTNLATWDFGEADFSEAPFFSATADEIVIDYNGIEVPIHAFHVEGTFAADASSIGGAEANGLADTRNMGPLLDLPDEPDSVCNVAQEWLGITCEACPDGGAYCLTLEALFDPAPLVEGLTLEEVVPEE